MGFHIAVTDLREGGSLEELARLPEQGITSYKLFMAYKGALMVDDETLFRTMEVAADTGALVMVHAENGDAIDVLVKQALAAGNTAPHYHALTRPPELEGEATNRAIQLARIAGAPLYVVHVSCKEAVDPIARAREQGWDVWGETCTQYFFIDYTYLERPDFEGAKYVYTPPPRDRENQEILWHAVRSDILSAVSTDHCAFLWDGQKSTRPRRLLEDPERRAGPREPAAHDPRVRRPRRPDLAEPHGGAARDEPGEAVRPLSAKGHDRAGLGRGHRRSSIPDRRHLITAATQHSKVDYNLYEGTEVTGSPELVMLRGNVLVESGELRRGAGCRRVRRAGRVRAGAPAHRRALDVEGTSTTISGCGAAALQGFAARQGDPLLRMPRLGISARRCAGHIPPCPAPSAQCRRSAAVRRTCDAVDLPDLPVERDDERGVADDLERRRLIERRRPDRRHRSVRVRPHQRSGVRRRRSTGIAAGDEVALREGEQRPTSAELDVHGEPSAGRDVSAVAEPGLNATIFPD